MIHYIVATDNIEKVETYIQPFRKKIKAKGHIHVNILNQSIFIKYNQSLDILNRAIKDEDVVVFLHDDLEIKDPYFEQKAQLYFKYKPNVGVAGVIGTTEYTSIGGWWHTDRTIKTRGRIWQGHPTQPDYEMVELGGMDDKGLISIDGCIMFMSGKIAKTYRFDDRTYSGFHFYDVDTCFTLLKKGFDIGLIDITVKHVSEGPLGEMWNRNRDVFLAKWNKLKFPVTIDSFKNYKYR